MIIVTVSVDQLTTARYIMQCPCLTNGTNSKSTTVPTDIIGRALKREKEYSLAAGVTPTRTLTVANVGGMVTNFRE